MSSKGFQFKQFYVAHHQSSMPVGTDGVLIGSWAMVSSCNYTEHSQDSSLTPLYSSPIINILDIGTGSGLIALMMAQRFPTSNVVGIDIDASSVLQASENASLSPFADRITILQTNILQFADKPHSHLFSTIVSNPPFFEEETYNNTLTQTHAKHTLSLTYDQLLQATTKLLTPDGIFNVIVPYSSSNRFISLAASHQLYLISRCDVRGNIHRPYIRSLLAFGRTILPSSHTNLTLRKENNDYSDGYWQLTKDFYLHPPHSL